MSAHISVHMQRRGDSVSVALNAVSISSWVKVGLAAYGRLGLCCWPGHLHAKCHSSACLDMTAFKVGERSEYQDLSEGLDKTKDLRGWVFLVPEESRKKKRKTEISYYACRQAG